MRVLRIKYETLGLKPHTPYYCTIKFIKKSRAATKHFFFFEIRELQNRSRWVRAWDNVCMQMGRWVDHMSVSLFCTYTSGMVFTSLFRNLNPECCWIKSMVFTNSESNYHLFWLSGLDVWNSESFHDGSCWLLLVSSSASCWYSCNVRVFPVSLWFYSGSSCGHVLL